MVYTECGGIGKYRQLGIVGQDIYAEFCPAI